MTLMSACGATAATATTTEAPAAETAVVAASNGGFYKLAVRARLAGASMQRELEAAKTAPRRETREPVKERRTAQYCAVSCGACAYHHRRDERRDV